jgi:hypothetical protein
LNLTGIAYIVKDFDDNLNRDAFYSLPSSWITPDHTDGPFSKFILKNPKTPGGSSAGIALGPDQVAFSYFPNPADPMGHISPASSQFPAIRIDEKIQTVSEKFFENGIFPSMIATVGRNPHPDVPGGLRPRLTANQRKQVVGAIRTVMGGMENYGGIGIVDGLIEDIKRISATQEEIGWEKSEDRVKMRILSAFCVHPFILGEPIGVGGYAQAYQIQDRFCSRLNVFLDLLSVLMTGLVNSNTEDKENLLVWWDASAPIDPSLEWTNWRFARENQDVSQNEFRAKLGLPPDEEYVETFVSPSQAPALIQLLQSMQTNGIMAEQARGLMEAMGIPAEWAKKIAGNDADRIPEEPTEDPIDSEDEEIDSDDSEEGSDNETMQEAIDALQAALNNLQNKDEINVTNILKRVFDL